MKFFRILFSLTLVALLSAGMTVFAADPKPTPTTKEPVDECVEPAAGPIGQNQSASVTVKAETVNAPQSPVMARVGSPAPDFQAPAYQDGGFKNIKLSDFKGKWVVLCFYPGDFTFV